MDEPDTLTAPHLGGDKECTSDSGSERIFSKRNPLRICLVGEAGRNQTTFQAAQKFGVNVVTTDTGLELVDDTAFENVFVIEDFNSPIFDAIHKCEQRILGPPALQQYAERGNELPPNSRPLYSLAMLGLVICFTGFRKKEEVTRLMTLIHHMGGSIRKDMVAKVTHLVANCCGGGKYQYAVAFRVPVVAETWVHALWEARGRPVQQELHKLKPFFGARVCFVGFSDDERVHMAEVLVSNGGVESMNTAGCTHLVVDSRETLRSLQPGPPHCSTPLSSPAPNAPPPTASPVSRPQPRQLSFDEHAPFWDTPTRHRATPIPEVATPIPEVATPPHVDTPIPESATPPVKTTPCVDTSTVAAPLPGVANESEAGCFKTPSSAARRASLLWRASASLPGAEVAAGNALRSRRLRLSMRVFGRRPPQPTTPPQAPPLDTSHLDTAAAESNATQLTGPVLEEAPGVEAPANAGVSRAAVVRPEWFWVSVQNEGCADEKDYLFDEGDGECVTSPCAGGQRAATPGSARARKRKRLRDAARCSQSPAAHKRRSSVSDANLLSISGSFLDATDPDSRLPSTGGGDEVEGGAPLSARQMVFLELVQTETNYVAILGTVMSMFKTALEDMTESEGPLLNATELKLIFGNLPPIFDIHTAMLDDLRCAAVRWTEDVCIGRILQRYMSEMVRAYPPFINFLEASREALALADASKPRFHAFLKICQARPECGRQTLQELLIRPVQRLPSISLLLNDILKHTSRANADHSCLEQALSGIKEVMTHINEDKRKTESQLAMFDIFREIDNCPADLLSSHRSLVSRVEATELGGGLGNRGDTLVLFLFSDMLEVCKRRGGRGAGSTVRSPTLGAGRAVGGAKPLKHLRLVPLPHVKRVIDVRETDECRRVFALVCRSSQELKERTFSLALCEEAGEKCAFLRLLCRQMANAVYKADAESFLVSLDAHQLDIATTGMAGGTLGKAFKFASRTRLKVGRAFSFNKTPSKLKRAVSTMMGSPFLAPSHSQLTPASQLAQMRLASCSNLHELASTPKPEAPMSVQPTRRNKTGTQSLNAASLRRL